MKLYEQFNGNELNIAYKILQRRLQMLVHSCIYYNHDESIVSDSTWSRWAKELEKLQNENPEISNKVQYAEYFKGWDGSSGAFLPIHESWVEERAERLLKIHGNTTKPITKTVQKQPKVKTKSMRLF
jgi:hypothetical protein